MKHLVLASAALLALASAVPAHAEPSPRTIAAERLFYAGRDLMAQRHFKEACEKLDASERLDPAVGTLFSLGECYAAQGRTASAWLAYRTAMAYAIERSDPRRPLAEARAAAMEPLLSTLEVRASDDVQVMIDREPFARDQLRAAMPLDPGSHTIEASAPGYVTWSGTVILRGAADVVQVGVPRLERVADTAARERARATRRAVGLVVGASGIAIMSAGVILGMQAIVKGRDANRACPGGGACSDAAAVAENNTAKTLADASTVTIPIGAAITALGTYLFLHAQTTGMEASVHVASNGGDVRVGWSW